MSGVEVLRTERLVLRHLTESDASFVLELLNEPGWLAGIGDRGVHSLEDAARFIDEGPGESYRRHGFGLWLVAKQDGEAVGMCGLIRREGLDHVDIGYAFLERWQGRGFASEAAAAVLQHGRRQIGLETIVAIVKPTNARSMAVLQKIGLKPAGKVQLPGIDGESAYFTT